MSCLETERSNFISVKSYFFFFLIYLLNFISYNGNRVYSYTRKAVCSGTTHICLILYTFQCKISLVNLYYQQMK